MGMFDHLRCEAPLPRSRVPLPEGVVFQTKDTPDQALTRYALGADGMLCEDLGAGGGLFADREPNAVRGLSEPLPLHQLVCFYHNEVLPARPGVDSTMVNLRAYGYDVVVWVRFLAEARGKTVWAAGRDDVVAFHRARRRGDAGRRISAASWNRSVASLDRLYRWAERQGLVTEAPFTHRAVWRRGHGGRRARLAARNDAYERVARGSGVRFVALDDYRVFRDVGLRGLTPAGAERPGARDRNGTRNALFAELLITTGLRLEEASYLLAHELAGLERAASDRQAWLDLPPGLTKGARGRRVLIPARLLPQLLAYIAVERASACAKFSARSGWRATDRPIFIEAPAPGRRLAARGGGSLSVDALTPDERGRLVVCDGDGAPQEAAVL